ncbi:MAG: hypothetical protein JKX85_15730 [Phycisphaeraceae bacterium]|nr:hypothetical protein [Phycisphaeraceae bacterium]
MWKRKRDTFNTDESKLDADVFSLADQIAIVCKFNQRLLPERMYLRKSHSGYLKGQLRVSHKQLKEMPSRVRQYGAKWSKRNGAVFVIAPDSSRFEVVCKGHPHSNKQKEASHENATTRA